MNYEVDQFVPGKRISSCQLYAKLNGQQEQSAELPYMKHEAGGGKGAL